MENHSKKSILILITNSFAAINVIHSGLLKKLADKYAVSLISTLIGQHEILQINEYFKINVKLLNIRVQDETRIIKCLRKVEKLLFCIAYDIKTQEIKISKQPVLVRALIRFLKFFAFTRSATLLGLIPLRKFIILFSSRLSSPKSLRSYHFDGVVSSSPLDIRENSIVNFLKRQNIKALGMIISWDNLTSKGIINARHDYLLVWNQLMANEFIRFYSVFKLKEKICITGIPRFDLHFRDGHQMEVEQLFRNQFAISPSDKVIFFATSAAKHFVNQKLIFNHLQEYLQLRENIILIVRCHPADNFELYKPYLHEGKVRIWHVENPVTDASRMFMEWLPPLDYLDSLSRMLKNCNVCVQVASTIRLDAAACDKPVISIAYDGDQILPWSHSVRRLYDYSHQVPVNQLAVDDVAFCKNDLFDSLDKILHENYIKPDLRKAIKSILYTTKPDAVEFSMKYIGEWLD
ncbi:CDP-glycerol glycerophosphotransferase family protein [Dyadobacter arcticus]|uniref:CDP-Glycerol:Poly(Glycerophosphate) glycerophosphotransferase n=1 Tax=Dyadobacter arcticus TaxID=1078754 RepID=A0ABX0UQR6_9BACT|nr:CDP-glycerol glycerophosphotransferase family protein [Dyadobacter arcticus]NIJ55337.1 hypothetical protein [Dyadobacter arcticus]